MKRLRGLGGGAGGLATVLALQAVAAAFFVGDVLADIAAEGLGLHVVFEAAVSAALVAGVAFGAAALKRVVERGRREREALDAARGALAEVLKRRFERWGLTPAESDVALLALKGFDTAEIAGLRDTAPGTVRAQLARIYAKAGVSQRAQLLALFIEELLAEPLPGEGAERRERE
mgnify:CR=1 FL=1